MTKTYFATEGALIATQFIGFIKDACEGDPMPVVMNKHHFHYSFLCRIFSNHSKDTISNITIFAEPKFLDEESDPATLVGLPTHNTDPKISKINALAQRMGYLAKHKYITEPDPLTLRNAGDYIPAVEHERKTKILFDGSHSHYRFKFKGYPFDLLVHLEGSGGIINPFS